MAYKRDCARAESIRIKDATDAHIRSLFRGLPHPKPTDKQRELASRRIAASAAYGHWVCVVGIRADADPANLKESDFYALDPARVSANGTLAVTRLLDGTIWTDNSPLKTAG